MEAFCLCALAPLATIACDRPETVRPAKAQANEPAWFRDASDEVGLDFVHDAGKTGTYFMPQIVGSGAAVLDINNDGRLDLYFIQNGGPGSTATNRLYRHDANGRFMDVSAGSGLDFCGYGMGVAVGDCDNDGWVDVYVSGYGGGRLCRNRGSGTFEDITRVAGVEQPGWGTSCCFFDYDGDGWLDLVVVNYVDYNPGTPCGPASGKQDYCHPQVFGGTSLRLFHNRGRDAAGRWQGFEDVTGSARLAKPGPGLGVACADFNGDGWPDILVANDGAPNHLWINQGNGTFRDEADLRGIARNDMGQAMANMGVALGDISASGRFDVFITHLGTETHTLWQQGATGLFQDRTIPAGLSAIRRGTGFGTILADFDLDGALDIALVNGRVARLSGEPAAVSGMDSFWAPYAETNQLLANDGGGRFHDISESNEAFCGSRAVARGLVWGDFDDDGRIDLVVTNIAAPARFFRNVAPRRGHWLSVRAIDPALHRDAYGAVVTLQTGSRQWLGMVNPGQSYLSSGDPRVHFGLGSSDHVAGIQIDWPDGLREAFPATPADRLVRLERGKGRKITKKNTRSMIISQRTE